jgi:hypothetical protein
LLEISVFVTALGVLLGAGCATVPVARWDSSPCAVLDSLYAASGFEAPLTIVGQATVDASQYRVRGKTRLDARTPGQMSLEFASTILFGHEREDFVFSLDGDTLRVVDRERGAYHEGDEAREFLARSLTGDLDVSQGLSLALGGHPACDDLSVVRVETAKDGKVVCTGERLGRSFRAVFGGNRRLETVVWPVRSDEYGTDALRVEYDWESTPGGGAKLVELVLSLEEREWRCKIKASGGE